jgi:hypothetical protein
MHSAALGILTVGAYEREDPNREAETNANSPTDKAANRKRDMRFARLPNSRSLVANRNEDADGL